MNQWGYVILGWSITVATLVVYTAIVLARGRALSRRLPPEQRRWM